MQDGVSPMPVDMNASPQRGLPVPQLNMLELAKVCLEERSEEMPQIRLVSLPVTVNCHNGGRLLLDEGWQMKESICHISSDGAFCRLLHGHTAIGAKAARQHLLLAADLFCAPFILVVCSMRT